jgi:hypothetical protein
MLLKGMLGLDRSFLSLLPDQQKMNKASSTTPSCHEVLAHERAKQLWTKIHDLVDLGRS